MARRTKVIAGALTAAVTALVGGLALPASTQAPAERVTLTFFDANGDDFDKNIDVKPTGEFSPGDSAVIWSKLLDPETCERVGSFNLNFQFVKPIGKEDGWIRVHGAGVLDDGDVYFDLTGKFSDLQAGLDGGVTGGSGAYKDVTGEILVNETRMCEKRGALITLDMLL
ncbi:MAG: hypothetical protein ACLGHL_03305 [Actinomycetota bacterium]